MSDEPNSNQESGEATNTKKSWTAKQRVLIYICFGIFAVTVGILLAYGWFFKKIETIKAESDHALQSMLYHSDDRLAFKVLFVGNSLIYNSSLPQQFATIYRSSHPGRMLKIYQVVVPGQSLKGHLETGNVQKFLEKKGPWNAVVIQPASYESQKKPKEFEAAATTLVYLTKSKGAIPYLFMTWADKGNYKEQKQISNSFHQLSTKLDCPLIPVGDLWFLAQEKKPALDLYQKDLHHPNATGSYIGALLVHQALTGSLAKNPPRKINVLGKEKTYLINLNEQQYRSLNAIVENFVFNYKSNPH